ncbi:hypothetical protein DMC01_07290 [Campylobacter troglodytis]|nr:hypothetical protein DMC01_07290 [Campylobacter troglodytis]
MLKTKLSHFEKIPKLKIKDLILENLCFEKAKTKFKVKFKVTCKNYLHLDKDLFYMQKVSFIQR